MALEKKKLDRTYKDLSDIEKDVEESTGAPIGKWRCKKHGLLVTLGMPCFECREGKNYGLDLN